VKSDYGYLVTALVESVDMEGFIGPI